MPPSSSVTGFRPGGGGRVDAAAGGDRAGQRDLGDLRVGGEGGAGGAVALHDREGAGGEAGLGEDLAELEGAERGELGGLEDQGVAAGERGRGLPAGDLGGVVPGADAEADAERLAAGEDEVAAEVDGLAREGGGEGGEPFEGVGAGGPVGDERLGERLAGVEGLELGELAVAGADQVGGAAEDAGALGRRGGGPGGEAVAGGVDRAVDDGGGGEVQAGDLLAGRRVADGEGLAGGVVEGGAGDPVRGGGLGAHQRAPSELEVEVVLGRGDRGLGRRRRGR